MNISKENINITHFLVGFHSHTKDHKFSEFKGDLINDISKELDLNFDVYSFGIETIIKSPEKDSNFFEIKLTSQAIIYQDNIPLEEFLMNSMVIFNVWKKYSSLINLRLVGLVRNFKISIPPVENDYKLNITDSFYKGKEIWDKIIFSSMTFRFIKNIAHSDYNIDITISENKETQNEITGFIDFNKTAINKQKNILENEINDIFTKSTEYFEKDFISFLSS
uniref:TIGR04255 family protein n=1 Tax=Ignavibacterium album TaxID=591197 RepID=A0A7V2ZL57_9BACT